jgi:hypothetical protein
MMFVSIPVVIIRFHREHDKNLCYYSLKFWFNTRISGTGAYALAGTCINNLDLQVFNFFLLFLILVVGAANAME